jgi:Rrf2 family protein
MQLTRAADYGVRAMVHLAGLPAGGRAGIAELAKAGEVSPAFLTKVLKRLTDAGLIVSHRGPNAGFTLTAPAGEVSLLDVVEAIEGPLRLNLCTGVCATPVNACHRQTWCAVSSVWMYAQAKLREALVQASLESLARDSARRLEAIRQMIF